MSERADLGPETEARLATLFARGPFASVGAVAVFLRMKPAAVNALADRGALAFALRGERRKFTERAVRAYLAAEAPAPGLVRQTPRRPRAGGPGLPGAARAKALEYGVADLDAARKARASKPGGRPQGG